VGDIGTGKSTLCRHLIRRFAADNSVETHLILDPYFDTPTRFLLALAELFGVPIEAGSENNRWRIKESLKKYLFKKGVDDQKTVVLIIDEGQKAPESCLELLRELLNYETNEHKLLQIVIFAQCEFHQIIGDLPNFADRINMYHVLTPLSFRETRQLLQFRLNKANGNHREPELFTETGLWAVYRASRGYPRKIIHLCHRVLVTLIIQNRSKAGWSQVRWCSRMLYPGTPPRVPWGGVSIAAILLLVLGLATFAPEQFEMTFFSEIIRKIERSLAQEKQPSTQQAAKRFQIPLPTNSADPERRALERESADFESADPQNATLSNAGQPISTQDGQPISSRVLSEDLPIEGVPKGGGRHVEPETHPPDPSQGTGGSGLSSLPAAFQVSSKSISPVGLQDPNESSMPQKTSPETSRSLPDPKPHPPEILGEITMKYGDTLETLIRKVYGHLDQQYLKAVMQSNPHITDKDNVAVGRPVNFPTLPFRVGILQKNGPWVQVDERNTLKDAYQVLMTLARNLPPLCMVPHWNSRDGLRFGILLKDCCVDEQAAEVALRGLPQSLASNARILNKWGDDKADQVFLAK
jgi:general secretion pathway protein A